MTQNEAEIIGKNVKDMYGTFMGKVAGTITDIDGSIQSVGIDCGSQGLQQVQYEQLVVQSEVVIFIPKWRLDSQRLIREKQLTLRRLRALVDIVSEDDEMRSDAQVIHQRYSAKLQELDETEQAIKAKLESRLSELGDQMVSAKTLVFDAKVQFKSNEISDATFGAVRSCTGSVIEHVSHEISEIENVKGRIADLELEARELTEPVAQNVQDSAMSYLGGAEPQQAVQAILPEAPTEPVPEEPPTPESAAAFAFPEPPKNDAPRDDNDGDWLARMEAQ